VNIFNKRMIVAIHPDAVQHVNVSNRQNYDKLQSYDVVRKYLIGDGMVQAGETCGGASAS
jgi:hypothetical protein